MTAGFDFMRFASEIAADTDVLAELVENGDIPSLVRTIDVHFKGDEAAAQRLSEDAETLGFVFLGFGEYDDGDWAIDLQFNGTTEPAAMAAFTRKALEMEATYGVEYDGWGCQAQTGTNN